MKTKFLLLLIITFSSSCGLLKKSNYINSNEFTDSIVIDKKSVCIDEDVQITINEDENTSKNTIYIIGNKTGNPAVLSFSTPGLKNINITINDVSNSNIETEQVEIDVKDCHSEKKISIISNPEEFNMGILNFRTTIEPGLIKKYRWNFGDGNTVSTENSFIQHDYRTRVQKSLFSNFIVKVTAIGNNGKEYSGRTSISIPNTNYLSKKLGTPIIPTKYSRFPSIKNGEYIFNININNIHEEPFIIEEISFIFRNHKTEVPLRKLVYNANEILKNTEVPGNYTTDSEIAIPALLVPKESTRISINIKGTLNHELQTYAKVYIDIPPKNDDIANNQGFEEVKNQVLIRKLEQAEKIYGKGRPITSREINMMEADHEK